MTKTELLNELAKLPQKVYSYSDIARTVNILTGYPEDKKGMGMFNLALYPRRGHTRRLSDDQSYFSRPSRGETRYLKRIARGKYVISVDPYEFQGK